TKTSLKPSISLDYPLNGERINPGTLINFSFHSTHFANLDHFWYSHNGTNYTIASPFSINTSGWELGENSISIYVNDTIGNVGKRDYSFIINETIGITPTYSKFKGNTTDIKILPDKTNVSNLVLEEVLVGKIKFLENVNVSGLDLNEYVVFTSRGISLNSSELPSLNVSANISLYNYPSNGIRNPRIELDGQECNATTTPSCYNFTPLNAETVIFNVSSFSTYEITGDEIEACMELNKEGAYYKQVGDIDSTGESDTCINITANDIIFDCDGYSITGDSSIDAIYAENVNNITVKNCNIRGFITGTLFKDVNNSFIDNINYSNIIPSIEIERTSLNDYDHNNTISNIFAEDGSYALYLEQASGNTIINLTANNFDDKGIDIYNSSRNYFNNIIIDNTAYEGIYSHDDSDNNTFENIFINDSIDGMDFVDGEFLVFNNITSKNNGNPFGGDAYGFYLENIDNSEFNNLTIDDNDGSGILFKGTENNTFNNIGVDGNKIGFDFYGVNKNNIFTDIYINDSSGVGMNFRSDTYNNIFRDGSIENTVNQDINIDDSSNYNNSFINVTYDQEIISTGELIRKWYFNCDVKDKSGNALSDANVVGYNVLGLEIFSDSTNETGSIEMKEIIEYINTNGTKNYSTPHTFNVSKSGYFAKTGYEVNSTVYNLTETNNIVHIVYLNKEEGSQTSGPSGNPTLPSYDYNQTLLCEETYYFIIDNMNNNELNYTEEDLDILLEDIVNKIGMSINEYEVISYLDNWESKCGDLVDLELPKPDEEHVPRTKPSNFFDTPNCSTLLNKTLIIPLDWAFPWWGWSGINVGNKSCKELDRDKWFWKYEKDGESYQLVGFRLYLIILPLLFILSFIFIISLIKALLGMNKIEVDQRENGI
ncbi:MAG: right-handed parallel beta-helix repeat-containing protein, partial [Candidatus Nanoarchaeia archaeon]